MQDIWSGYPAWQSGIRPDTAYKKTDHPAGYPVHPYFALSEKV
jgi:hypothetical protein